MIYIGHDEREDIAFDVCKHSISTRSNIKIKRLSTADIPEYNRDWGEPQSTDFTFSRFWVPYLSKYEGISIFCDCDFLFLRDPKDILEKLEPNKAVHVVKHPAYIPNSQIKMDGIPQHRSYRKNWASLMVFNNSHPACRTLTPHHLNNHKPGLDFHHFKWCRDEDIGSLTLDWNCLSGYYYMEKPSAVHYTDGGPWFKEYSNCMYSDLWHLERFQEEKTWRSA